MSTDIEHSQIDRIRELAHNLHRGRGHPRPPSPSRSPSPQFLFTSGTPDLIPFFSPRRCVLQCVVFVPPPPSPPPLPPHSALAVSPSRDTVRDNRSGGFPQAQSCFFFGLPSCRLPLSFLLGEKDASHKAHDALSLTHLISPSIALVSPLVTLRSLGPFARILPQRLSTNRIS